MEQLPRFLRNDDYQFKRRWMSSVSPLDAFMSVKMGTFREFQLYMVW
jgi:hypothetical protein